MPPARRPGGHPPQPPQDPPQVLTASLGFLSNVPPPKNVFLRLYKFNPPTCSSTWVMLDSYPQLVSQEAGVVFGRGRVHLLRPTNYKVHDQIDLKDVQKRLNSKTARFKPSEMNRWNDFMFVNTMDGIRLKTSVVSSQSRGIAVDHPMPMNGGFCPTCSWGPGSAAS